MHSNNSVYYQQELQQIWRDKLVTTSSQVLDSDIEGQDYCSEYHSNIREEFKCKKTICQRCSQSQSFRPSFDDIRTSMDVVHELNIKTCKVNLKNVKE